MGYACPVCGDPQADGEHLANHLAFTAMLGDADHEDWLDEHAPDWGDSDPVELAERVTDHADEREFPQVFEDTTEDGHGHDHSHGDHAHSHDGHGEGSHTHGVPDDIAPDGVTDPSDVLAEARELTEQRRTNDGDESRADGESEPADADEESDGE